MEYDVVIHEEVTESFTVRVVADTKEEAAQLARQLWLHHGKAAIVPDSETCSVNDRTTTIDGKEIESNDYD